MQINFVIFIGAAVLLVPFIYATTYVPDACAAIRSPSFDLGDCTQVKDNKKTCCWYEKSYPGQFGRGDKVCQTCTYYHDSNGNPYEKCSEPKKQTIKLPSGSQLLQDLPELKSTANNTIALNESNGITSRTENNNDNDTLGFNIPDNLQESDAPTIEKNKD